MNILNYSASGKLLLFGEYLVLRDADCLAIPLSFGQEMRIYPYPDEGILWRCFEFEKRWLEIRFSKDLEIIQTSDSEKAAIVRKLLQMIKNQNPGLKISGNSFRFQLNFNRLLGFGTSSTFVSLLSQWSGVDPYFLLRQSFGGSGYDIAAATVDRPFIYSLSDKLKEYISIPGKISSRLLFVYLGKKQRSNQEVARFKNIVTHAVDIDWMNTLVSEAIHAKDILHWEKLMTESENFLSSLLKVTSVKKLFFSDYPYAIKSLGAWGGDFIMATCRYPEEGKKYFREKGKEIIYTFEELVSH